MFKDKILYDTFRRYLRGICDSSLDWRPGSPKFKDVLDSLSSQKSVVDLVCWWEPGVDHREEIAKWMQAFSYSYQDRLGILTWDEEIFSKTYERFEDFLYSEELTITFISPVYLFGCDLREPIEIYTDAGIIRKEFDVNMRCLLSFFETEGKHFSEDYDWYMYTHRKVSKTKPRESSSGDNKDMAKLEDILMSLRLLHGGLVHAGPLCSDEGSPFAGIHGGYRQLSHAAVLKRLPADYMVFQSYTLERAEIETLQKIYKQIRSLNRSQREFLHVTLGRFHDSYERQNDRDRLVDLCIALESLYVRENDELAYHLALRCAYFLEKEKVEIENAFHKIRDIYKSRSRIVHGTGKQLSEETLYQLVTDAEEYVRRSVCKLLSNIKYINHISKKPLENETHFLDKIIFGTSAMNH